MRVLTATFVGDVCVQEEPRAGMIGSSVCSILAGSDINCCNFEAPPRCSEHPSRKAGPTINQHPQVAEYLLNAGFNLFTIANNHIMDYGIAGLSAALNLLGKDRTVGAGMSVKDAYQPAIFCCNGVRLGVCSYCEAEFGMVETSFPHVGTGFAWVNDLSVDERIIALRREVDALVVIVHAGVEEIPVPLPEWRARYRRFIDIGADCVVGHHPHVPQGVEFWKGKPICFSLGNFLFPSDTYRGLWNIGLLARMTFTKSGFNDIYFIPTKFSGGVVNITHRQRVLRYLDCLNKILLDESVYLSLCERFAKRLWNSRYLRYYLASVNGMTSKTPFKDCLKILARRVLKRLSSDPVLLLHNIRIESHRFAVCRYLQRAINENGQLAR